MAALFCILRDCGQEVYGKVHKTLGVFSEKGVVEMEAVRLCWKPPTESPGSHFNPGHKGKRSGTGFLPSLLPLCYSGKNQASEPTPETPFRAAFTPPRLCSLKAQLPSPSEFCGDPLLVFNGSVSDVPTHIWSSEQRLTWRGEVMKG